MSETNKSKEVPKNTIAYMVYGAEKEITVKSANQQPANVNEIPGIPMEIPVDTHTCEILPNGEIVRKKDGKQLPGEVTNKKVKEALTGKKEVER